jgi:hypothetical protein
LSLSRFQKLWAISNLAKFWQAEPEKRQGIFSFFSAGVKYICSHKENALRTASESSVLMQKGWDARTWDGALQEGLKHG